MTELIVDPAHLSFVDVATSSHNHTDHLDAETLGPILAGNPSLKLVIPEANRAFVADRLQFDPAIPVGLDDGGSVELLVGSSRIRFIAVASAHDEVERDEEGHVKALGYVVQFGHWSLYHSGDTLRYDGMAEKLRPFAVDVALLPINGRAPERRVSGKLSGPEAAQLAHDIGASLVIPCHFDMFEFYTAAPDAFANTCRRLGQPFRILRCGERFDS